MPPILNASAETQHFMVWGNHFTLKPGQIKNFQDAIAHFLATERGYLGLVRLPEEFEDSSYANTEEGKKALLKHKEQGVKNRCAKLREVIYNNQVSLRQDLERANLKIDPRLMMSDGELAAMEELVKYQKLEEDKDEEKLKRIQELEKKIKVKG